MASFLLNVPDSAGRRNVHETTRWGGVMGFYFQDSWKATPALTVNLGLRYDRTFIPPYGKESTLARTAASRPAPSISTTVPMSCRSSRRRAARAAMRHAFPAMARFRTTWWFRDNGKIYHDTTTNWGPRIGLAYRASSSIRRPRAGFGIFYDNWAAVTQTAQNYEGYVAGYRTATRQQLERSGAERPPRPTSTGRVRLRGRWRVPGAYAFRTGAVVHGSLRQESVLDAVEFRRCQAVQQLDHG